MSKQKSLVRGVVAGIAGGLVASWVMNEFIAGPGQKLQHALQSEDQNREAEAQSSQPKEDATMKTADAVVNIASGGQHLSWAQKEKSGPIVHYAFGAIMGGVYGALAEYSSWVKSNLGTTFGSALFSGADLIAVPVLRLGPPPTEQPKSALASPFAAHVVYGATTEVVRRVVRAAL